MLTKIGECLVRVTGEIHRHIFGIVGEETSHTLNSTGNGFQCLLIHHGNTLTIISQQSTSANMGSNRNTALVHCTPHLTDFFPYSPIGMKKQLIDLPLIIAPRFLFSHHSIPDEDLSVLVIVNIFEWQSSISQCSVLLQGCSIVHRIVDDRETGEGSTAYMRRKCFYR